MSEKRRIWKFFGVWNSDKEEQWLVEKASEGWILESVGFLNYTFRKAEPQAMCYQFDFVTHKKADQEEYLKIYEEAGWNMVGMMGSWYYFAKPKRVGEAQKIYTDKGSLSDMYKRLIAFLLIINGPAIYYLMIIHTSFTIEMPALITTMILILVGTVEVLIIYAIVRIALCIRHLNSE